MREGSVGDVLKRQLVEHGLWENEADSVLDAVRGAEHCKPLADVLHKSADGYPESFINIAWLTVKQMAIAYLDENQPEHFARALLAA